MFVDQVRALFDQYVDEDDLTFLSVTQRRDALSRGYDSFRQQVIAATPWAYNRQQDFTLNDVSQLDLTTSTPAIMGSSAAAGTRLQRLYRIALLNTNSNVWQFLEASPTLDGVLPRDYFDRWEDVPTYYVFLGTTLELSRKLNGTLRLYYLPEANVDWTQDTSGDNEFIDDYGQFHKLIAMYAARDYYTVRDGERAAALEAQIYNEEQRLLGFLGVGRDVEANSMVAERF